VLRISRNPSSQTFSFLSIATETQAVVVYRNAVGYGHRAVALMQLKPAAADIIQDFAIHALESDGQVVLRSQEKKPRARCRSFSA